MRLHITVLVTTLLLYLPAAHAAPEITLAHGGKSVHPVVIAPTASEQTKTAAKTLAEMLSRITGAGFSVQEGDGKAGIAVGFPGDFPKCPFTSRWTGIAPRQREDYLLRTHPGGVYLLGATDLAVEHAVWDFLYSLGYRQFFPGNRWEVVPKIREPKIALDVEASPDYYARRIWYGYGTWDYNAEPYKDWCAKNRATSAVQLSTGHAYGGIIRACKQAFEEHPEYYALVDGKRDVRPQAKLCIGNPDLRKTVVKYALSRFDKNPDMDSISMDPSDGGGWCECQKCAALGSVTDRALLLANEVAAAINEKYPGKLVGMYAYNYHSPPPSIKPHPQVVVSVATAFLKGGLTLDEILDGWSEKGATLGIREYYSVNTWDRDMPGDSRGSNLEYLTRTIPAFYARGARFLSAESSDNWAPNGPGYYLAARMLWDVDEAGRTDELVDDFLTKAFGAAKEPMAEFYRQLDGSRPHLVFDDQLGRMFRALAKARQQAKSSSVRARIDDLTLYARYVDLFHRYAGAKDATRQEAFERLIRHAYRMRKTMLVHAKALYRDLVRRDKMVRIPEEADWRVVEEKNPWKSSEPFTETELAAFLKEGIERYPLTELDFKPAHYGDDLVPAAGLESPDAPRGDFGAGRGAQVFFTYVREAPANLELRITGGLIKHYRDRGNVRVELWKIGGASAEGQMETPVATDRGAAPDGVERAVTLAAKEPGLYKIIVHDGGDRTLVDWPEGQPMAVRSEVDAPMNSHYHNWAACFYVPKGARVIGLYGGDHGEIQDSAGRTVFWLNGREPNYYSVEVPDGQDGKLWRVRYGRGAIRLLTVPPYFARSAQELLLPREVVEGK